MMFDKIKEAKENSHGIVFENYQPPDMTWEEVLNFLYKESVIPNHNLEEKVKQHNILSCEIEKKNCEDLCTFYFFYYCLHRRSRRLKWQLQKT
jgi:hypothetical protein